MIITDREVVVRYRQIYDREGNKRFWKEWYKRVQLLRRDGFLEDYIEYCREYE